MKADRELKGILGKIRREGLLNVETCPGCFARHCRVNLHFSCPHTGFPLSLGRCLKV